MVQIERGTYSFDVHRVLNGPAMDVVARDPVLGTWKKLSVHEADSLECYRTFTPSEYAVQRLTYEMDMERHKVVDPLYTARSTRLLDYVTRCQSYEALRMLGVEESLRGMSPFAPHDWYSVSAERDDACQFVREHPEIETYEEFCVKISLQGHKPFYNKAQFETVREVYSALKRLPESSAPWRHPYWDAHQSYEFESVSK